ncbi:hypothetical protein Pla52n_58380 [Stieleria varia]|uniref:Uncharacterized protein n=1 Tax=Stieleria varia TaxID=2528005 RepID=A0A5C6A1T7_9BACT|nr:hypothetical protein Pla52n_58380 [Stieleria varia]
MILAAEITISNCIHHNPPPRIATCATCVLMAGKWVITIISPIDHSIANSNQNNRPVNGLQISPRGRNHRSAATPGKRNASRLSGEIDRLAVRPNASLPFALEIKSEFCLAC